MTGFTCVSFAVVFGLSSSFSSLADQISCGIQRTNKQDLCSRLLQYFKEITRYMAVRRSSMDVWP